LSVTVVGSSRVAGSETRVAVLAGCRAPSASGWSAVSIGVHAPEAERALIGSAETTAR
jgi:hypothetical protein